MNFVSELVDDCPTIPSGALKEQFLVLLESNERSMKVLANVLKIDIVRELVRNYEECHGQVSLDTWKYVFQQLGYSKEHFQQLVFAYQMIPDATDIIADLEENGRGAQSISRVWPKWSLPPRDESLLKENLVEGAAKGDDDRDFSLQAAAENGPLHENDGIPSTVQSSLSQGNASTLGVVPVVENGRSHHENSTLAEIHEEGREENAAASSVQVDHKQQLIDNKATTPSRPASPEAPRSTHDPVVTGQHRSHQNNAVAKPYPSGNGEESQESGNPSKTATAYQMIPDATDIIADLEENGRGEQSISRVWPKWSLPPRDESLLKENLVEGAAKSDDDRDFSLQAAAENGPSHENDGIPSTVQSSLCDQVHNLLVDILFFFTNMLE